MTRFVSISTMLACALALCATIVFFGCGPTPQGNTGGILAGPTPPPADCDKGPTSDVILKAVYDRLKAEGVENQWWQFNITADDVNKKVRITGWSPQRPQIIGWVKLAAPHCTIQDDSFAVSRADFESTPPYNGPSGPVPPYRVGCPPNYIACGDICVPSTDACKITAGMMASPPNTVTCEVKPSPTPTPGGKPAANPSKSP